VCAMDTRETCKASQQNTLYADKGIFLYFQSWFELCLLQFWTRFISPQRHRRGLHAPKNALPTSITASARPQTANNITHETGRIYDSPFLPIPASRKDGHGAINTP